MEFHRNGTFILIVVIICTPVLGVGIGFFQPNQVILNTTLERNMLNKLQQQIEGLDQECVEAIEKAYYVARIDNQWTLRRIAKDFDPTTYKKVWTIIWDRGAQMRKIQIECDSHNLISFIDTSKLVSNSESYCWLVEEEEARSSAFRFLSTQYNHLGGIDGATARERSDGWFVEIERCESGFPCRDDYIRIKVNPFSGEVSAFTIKWTENFADPSCRVTSSEAIQKAVNLGLFPASYTATCKTSLEWITQFENPSEAKLTWVIENELGRIGISAMTGDFLKDGRYLIQYEGSSVNTDYSGDESGDPAYDIMEYVYDILDSNLNSAVYINQPSKSQWLTRSSSYVFFSVGHGGYTGTCNRIQIDDGQPISYVYASDITSNVPNRYLVYLLHCYSGWSSLGNEEDCIPYQMLWHSKQTTFGDLTIYQNAVVTFDDAVDQADGVSFTEAFWDALDDGDTVSQAFACADTQEPDIGDITVILGNQGVTL
ncbi:MAG: hypothetical protein BAJATHORv1_90007 [Candidatus Thorarchaeota archaeon]|nr:MAG: hypothetical protein BAJATHORv1_90007 [Candidatus Thorarchaeota archaeon]